MWRKEDLECYLTVQSMFCNSDKSPTDRTCEEFYQYSKPQDKAKVGQFYRAIDKLSGQFIKEVSEIVGKKYDDTQHMYFQ